MFYHIIGFLILLCCFYSCSDNDHEKIRQEMDQIADQKEKTQEIEL